MEQKKTNPNQGLRALIDELYSRRSKTTVTSGIEAENGGVPVAGGPFATIDVHGTLTAANEGGGVLGLTGAAGVTSVSGNAPITSTGGATPAIGITAASDAAAGSMSAADKTKEDQLNSLVPGFAFNPAPVLAAVTQPFSTGNITVGASGTISFIAMMTVGTSGGATAPGGDAIGFQALLDGALYDVAVGVTISGGQEMGTINSLCQGTIVAKITGLVPASVHTVGIVAADVTDGTKTLGIAAAAQATILYWA